jgi:methoxymalonate biosynthesis acyl carrier protein
MAADRESMSTTRAIEEYILAEYLPGTPIDELDPTYDLLENGVVDSLGLLRLVAWVGENYHIPVDDIEISPENFRSVNEISQFVERSRRYQKPTA